MARGIPWLPKLWLRAEHDEFSEIRNNVDDHHTDLGGVAPEAHFEMIETPS